MHRHYKEQCEHGAVGGQCRCPFPEKAVVLTSCPSRCPFKSAPTGVRYPPPGVKTSGR